MDWYRVNEDLALVAHLAFVDESAPEALRWLKQHETSLFQEHANRVALAIIDLAKQEST